MSDNVNTRVANFSKILVEKKDFPRYVLEQFDVVVEAEKRYYEAISPLAKNTAEIRSLSEEKNLTTIKSYQILSIIFNNYRVIKDIKKRNLYFSNERPNDIKRDVNKMREIIDIMLSTNKIKPDEIIEQYKDKLQEVKDSLDKVISSGNLIGNKKLLKLLKEKAKESFENEYLKLKHLVIAALIGTEQDYRIFFPTLSKKKVKSDSQQ